MRALLHFATTPALEARIRAVLPGWLDLTVVPEGDPAAFGAEIPGCEVLWHVLEPVTAAVMDAAPRLRLVQKIGVGVNTIDLDAARLRGVAVANMPGTNTAATAEFTLALMLAALRRVPHFDACVREGRWYDASALVSDCGEVGGRTVGLVGYGAVARALAAILDAMGARVVYTSRSPKADAVGERVGLDELLVQSDIVSLHVPLTDATRNLLDAAAFARMREGAVLVNTARGGLVDEDALVAALRSGRLRAAALDVFAAEPVAPAHPLLSCANVVVAPHAAWLTPETFDRSIGVAVDNCRRVRDGEVLLHTVVGGGTGA